MSIAKRVQTSKDARASAILAAIEEGVDQHRQLPTRVEEESGGAVTVHFNYGATFVGSWDHSGERPAYVCNWVMRPRWDRN